MDESSGSIRATVLVDGMPVKRSLAGQSTVRQIIGELLPDGEKARAGDYALSPEDGPPLDPSSRIGDSDVPDGSILALTKVDGGGGSCSGS